MNIHKLLILYYVIHLESVAVQRGVDFFVKIIFYFILNLKMCTLDIRHIISRDPKAPRFCLAPSPQQNLLRLCFKFLCFIRYGEYLSSNLLRLLYHSFYSIIYKILPYFIYLVLK